MAQVLLAGLQRCDGLLASSDVLNHAGALDYLALHLRQHAARVHPNAPPLRRDHLQLKVVGNAVGHPSLNGGSYFFDGLWRKERQGSGRGGRVLLRRGVQYFVNLVGPKHFVVDDIHLPATHLGHHLGGFQQAVQVFAVLLCLRKITDVGDSAHHATALHALGFDLQHTSAARRAGVDPQIERVVHQRSRCNDGLMQRR